ncbi:hypothetical protein TNCV_1160341 [Trichonephila clavipes]|nr:hypothetical protein TNCV_1160341 [Trichonephila clavipes]
MVNFRTQTPLKNSCVRYWLEAFTIWKLEELDCLKGWFPEAFLATYINGLRVFLTKDFLVIEPKLTWKKHIDSTVDRGYSRSQLLKRSACVTWGSTQDGKCGISCLTKVVESRVPSSLSVGVVCFRLLTGHDYLQRRLYRIRVKDHLRHYPIGPKGRDAEDGRRIKKSAFFTRHILNKWVGQSTQKPFHIIQT